MKVLSAVEVQALRSRPGAEAFPFLSQLKVGEGGLWALPKQRGFGKQYVKKQAVLVAESLGQRLQFLPTGQDEVKFKRVG